MQTYTATFVTLTNICFIISKNHKINIQTVQWVQDVSSTFLYHLWARQQQL